MRASLLSISVALTLALPLTWVLSPSPALAAGRRVAVVGVGTSGPQASATGTVSRALEDAVRAQAGLEWVDLTRVAAPDVAEQRRQALEEGQHALLKATQLFEEQKAEPAQEQLTLAVARLEESDLEQALPSLFEALNLSALVAQKQGKAQEARARLEHAFTLRPDHVVDPTRVTPAFAQLAAEAKARVEAAGKGTLGLRTIPPGAAAYVDGRYVGLTPLEVEGLRQGPHYVTVKLPGYTTAQERLQVESTTRVSLPLQVSLKGAELQTRLVALEAAFADELERPKAVQALAAWAALDEVWLARVEPKDGGQLVRALRLEESGRLLVEAEQLLAPGGLEKPHALEPLIRSLLGPSVPGGSAAVGVSSRATPPGPPLAPRRKWALAAAGTGVALAAGGLFFGLRANDQAEDARALQSGDPNAYDSAASRARRSALFADLCWVGAVAGATTGAVLWFTGGDSAGKGKPGGGEGDLRWSLGPSGEGVAAAVTGSF